MDEVGKVIKVSGQEATVAFTRKAACESCGMCFGGAGSREMQLTLKNDVGADVGDTVRVASSGALASMLIVYMIPLVLLFAGLLGANAAFHNDIITFFCGIACLVLGIFVVNRIDKALKKSKRRIVLPQIVNIEKKAVANEPAADEPLPDKEDN